MSVSSGTNELQKTLVHCRVQIEELPRGTHSRRVSRQALQILLTQHHHNNYHTIPPLHHHQLQLIFLAILKEQRVPIGPQVFPAVCSQTGLECEPWRPLMSAGKGGSQRVTMTALLWEQLLGPLNAKQVS